MRWWKEFYKGLFDQNPIFRLALSLCPALAVTSTATNALAMGLSVMFVITMNNIVVSFTRRWVNPTVRVPVYITSIATIVTVVQLVLQAYLPALYKELGLYLALIVVFAIILARAEVFAAKNGVLISAIDGFGMGAGFLLAMLLIGIIREVVGVGTLFGYQVMPLSYNAPLIMILAPGGFLLIGLLIGFFNFTESLLEKRRERLMQGGE